MNKEMHLKIHYRGEGSYGEACVENSHEQLKVALFILEEKYKAVRYVTTCNCIEYKAKGK